MLRHHAFFTLVLLSGAAVAHAQPEPPVPQLTGMVVDDARVLSQPEAVALTERLHRHERETGQEVVVLTVQSLQGEPVEDLAVRVFAAWHVGKARHDNGVLLVLAMQEHAMRIEVGYGLEAVLTDAQAKGILRGTLVPAMRRGEVYGGIDATVTAIFATIEAGAHAPPAAASPELDEHVVLALFAAVLAAMLTLGVWGVYRWQRRSRGLGSSRDPSVRQDDTPWLSSPSTQDWGSGGSSGGGSDSGGGGGDTGGGGDSFSGGGGESGGGGASDNW